MVSYTATSSNTYNYEIFIRRQQNQSLSSPVLSIEGIIIIMIKHCHGRGLISKIYNLLVDESPEMSVKRLEAWRVDLQENISNEEWKAQSQTVYTHLKILQHNWLMRTYLTSDKLNKFNSAISDICVKCEKETTLSLSSGNVLK